MKRGHGNVVGTGKKLYARFFMRLEIKKVTSKNCTRLP